MERGDFEQKCQFAFDVYDVFGRGCLDLLTLREVLRKSFAVPLASLNSAHQVVSSQDRWNFNDFNAKILPSMGYLQLCQDRMIFHKDSVAELESCHGFTLEKSEHLFNLYKPTFSQPLSIQRLKLAQAFQANSPELVSREQFKLIMGTQFGVKDVQLTN
jgi:hypothetical protein